MRTLTLLIIVLFSISFNIKSQERISEKNKMKTAIIFASSHGTTEKIARLISEKLDSTTVQLFNLKKCSKIDLSGYENIIIGGSIHAGNIQSEIKKFIRDNTITLMQKKIALYLCCMNEPEEQKEFDTNYPELLRAKSSYNAIVGGEFLFDKMNFIERFLVKKISGVSSTTTKLRYNEIDNLVNTLKNEKSN